MTPVKAHMICHTHWDREWYLTREEFRVKLVRLIDGLLDIVENDPEYVSFMLDGQMIVLEDYLEIKPRNRERLKKALSEGKILCGPWYVLPDELLISGEAHIRNYLMGRRVMGDMGTPMHIAYLPDSFGHPEQMPQIIRGLGMDTMVFWRGAAHFMRHTEFHWEAPDKASRVLCVHMPHGYGNSARISCDMDKSIPRLRSMIGALASASATDRVLLMNGSDHITGQRDVADIVKAFNGQVGDAEIRLSTLEAFIKELKAELPAPELETYTGEFRYGERSMLLGGTLSTRMPLKQNNHAVQKTMERYLEPVLAWERLAGGREDSGDYCAYLWRKILENHPHDSICGCSIDAVHAEMMTRFGNVRQLQNLLLADSFRRIEKLAREGGEKADAQWLLFEPTQDRTPSCVEAEVDLDRCLVQAVDFEKSVIEDYEDGIRHPPIPQALRIVDGGGRVIRHRILSAEKAYATDYQDETLPEVYKVNRLRVELLLPGYDYGFHILKVYKAEDPASKAVLFSGSADERPEIENEYYKISFHEDALKVLDKKTGRTCAGVNRLVDKGDAGDEYTYSWPLEDRTFYLDPGSIRLEAEKTEISRHLKVSGSLELAASLTEDRKKRSDIMVSCPVEMVISLYEGIDRIDIKTVIENRACDHLLQVELPSGILAGASLSESCFSLTRRDIERSIPGDWVEYPQSTHPTHGFISLSDGKYGLSAIGHGLTEFEAENREGQSVLRITLLRCVGWLSRNDLLTRKGNGGWSVETPDAQLIGRHSFQYSFTWHEGDWAAKGHAYPLLHKHVHPSMAAQLKRSAKERTLPGNPLACLSDLPWDIRLSAVKLSEKGESLMVRLYSLAAGNREIALKLPDGIREVYLTNLAEERCEKVELAGSTLQMTLEPFRITTFEWVCRPYINSLRRKDNDPG